MAIRRIRGEQLELGWKAPVATVTGLKDVGPNINFGAAPLVVGGLSLNVNDRVLVNHQTNNIQNGIYRVVTPGTGSDGVWVRADDMVVGEIVLPGTATLVEQGDWGGQVFYINTGGTDSGFNVGTDGFNWGYSTNWNQVSKGDMLVEDCNNNVDGTTTQFTTSYPFFSLGALPLSGPDIDTILVFLNGVQLEAGVDYSHDGIDTVTLLFPPKIAPGNPDKVKIWYYQALPA